MVNSGDKFASLLLPNCQRTASQEEKLQSSLFARESPDEIRQSSSSTDESSEQVTGIELVSLPDSFDEYQTPPEQPSHSQNSSNDGRVAVAETKTTTADFDGETEEQRIVDLANDSDDLIVDTEVIDVADQVNEVVETELIKSPEKQSAHQVFDEMREREHEGSKQHRQLPVSVNRLEKEKMDVSKHEEAFADVVNRVLKMAGEAKSSRGGEDGDVEVDFLETAKMRGLTFPRPRWWPTEGFKD